VAASTQGPGRRCGLEGLRAAGGARRSAGPYLHRRGLPCGQRGSVAGHLRRGAARHFVRSGRLEARSPGAAGCAAFASGAGRGCTRGSSAAARGELPRRRVRIASRWAAARRACGLPSARPRRRAGRAVSLRGAWGCLTSGCS
jgi:hypothetical protein